MENYPDNQNYAWAKEIRSIIDEYKDGDETPLSPAEVEVLVTHIKNKINLLEGNITPSQYEEIDGAVYIPANNIYVPKWITEADQRVAYTQWKNGYKLGAVKHLFDLGKHHKDSSFKLKASKQFVEELAKVNINSETFKALSWQED